MRENFGQRVGELRALIAAVGEQLLQEREGVSGVLCTGFL